MLHEESIPRIVVMGVTGSGKSTFVNLVSGSNLLVSNGLKSCTSEVTESIPFTLDDQNMILVDTPGLDDTSRNETDIVTTISTYLANIHKQGIKLAGVIYTHRISDVRMYGTSMLNFRIFRELCGNTGLASALIVTTMWSKVAPEIGKNREQELATAEDLFKPALDNGAQLVRHDGTPECARDILRHIYRKSTTLRIQRELVDEGREFINTAVGNQLSRTFTAQAERLNMRYKKLRKQTEDALLAQDEESLAALRLELDEVKKERRHIEDESKRLQIGLLPDIDTDIVHVSHELVEHLRRPYLHGNLQAGLSTKRYPEITLQERPNEPQNMRKPENGWEQHEAHAISATLQELRLRSAKMYEELQASRSHALDRQRRTELFGRVDQIAEEVRRMQRQIDDAIQRQARLMAELKQQQEGGVRNFCDRMLAWFLSLP